MKGINYVNNDKGDKIAIMIDLEKIKDITEAEKEDIEDLIAIELRKYEPTTDWEIIKKNLKKEGKLD